MKRSILLISYILFQSYVHAQQIKILTNQPKISLRGLSVVNDNIIWASGSNGQVAKSVDGGKSFQWITVKNYEHKDFRDIEAFDANTALIMAVDSPGIILKTKDGGKTWKEVFHDNRKGMFLDAMDFDEKGNGTAVGDPINNKLFIATTGNYGDNWLAINPENNFYTADTGEAFFAASGTNIKIAGNKYHHIIYFVTGGTDSRLFYNGQPLALNIIKGKGSQGANSIAVDSSGTNVVVVGGDFNNDTSAEKNIEVFKFHNGNLFFPTVQTPPHGYRSCVAFISQHTIITCGTTGVDISDDSGLNWRLVSTESYNVCAKAKRGNAVFLAGKDGRIAKLEQ